jgi:hypothetical protein
VSPLWSDTALAEAAWANAVERGLVDEQAKAPWPRRAVTLERVRKVPRPRLHSHAL